MRLVLISIVAFAALTVGAEENSSKLPAGQVLPEARPVEYASEFKPHVGGMFGAASGMPYTS